MPFPVCRYCLCRFVDAAPCVFETRVHYPRFAGNELVFGVGGNGRSGCFDVAGCPVPVLHINKCEPVFRRQCRSGFVDAVVVPVAIVGRDERVVVSCGYCSCRFLYRYTLALRTTAIILGKETHLCHAEPTLRCNSRTRLVNARSMVFTCSAHAVPFYHECLLAARNELYQSRIYPFQRRIDERFFASEDAFSLVRKVQHLPHGFPAV